MNPGEPPEETLRSENAEVTGPDMLSRASLGLSAAVILSVGCGSTLYLATEGRSPHPPVETFECVKSRLPVLGYTQTSNDVESHRITARRYDREARYADSRFQRMIERLTIEIGNSSEGGALLRIEAHTFVELATHRGPTEIEQEASPGVRAAGQALREACGN